MNNYRHGDVILVRVECVPADAKPAPGLVLAEGEATGHHHAIVEGRAVRFLGDDGAYLRVESDVATIDHPEHGRRSVPRGAYRVVIQREWSEDGWENVID